MKKIIIGILISLILLQMPYSQSITMDPPMSPVTYRYKHWLEPPVKGAPVKENKIKVMLWRADKPRISDRWRYRKHVTSREYLDCSYYKYVDCRDIRFCRCWQCKDYHYDFVIRN